MDQERARVCSAWEPLRVHRETQVTCPPCMPTFTHTCPYEHLAQALCFPYSPVAPRWEIQAPQERRSRFPGPHRALAPVNVASLSGTSSRHLALHFWGPMCASPVRCSGNAACGPQNDAGEHHVLRFLLGDFQ